MAKIVEQVLTIKFSKLVRNTEEEDPLLISDEDLELAQSVADELQNSDPSRVVEIDLED